MQYIDKLKKSIDEVMCNSYKEKLPYCEMVEQLLLLFLRMKKNNNMIFFVGNGGSAGIAVHMTADFLKNGGIKTHSMFDLSTITCLANDFGYEYIFSKQLQLVAEKNDVVIAISSSGNSPNIINSVNVAKQKGCTVITFSGFKEDNKLRQLGDYNVYVPSMEYGIVESIHNMILQQIVDEIVAKDGVGLK